MLANSFLLGDRLHLLESIQQKVNSGERVFLVHHTASNSRFRTLQLERLVHLKMDLGK